MWVVDLPLGTITPAPWNPNVLDPAMLARLRRSIERFGPVAPLVVREVGPGAYETVGGAPRLRVLQELGYEAASCVVVQADDAQARLLAQALNRLHGEDDLGLRAQLVREVLERLPEEEVLALLPETAESLASFVSPGQEDLAAHLETWQRAQAARLRHFTAQLTPPQLEVVEEALARFLAEVSAGDEGNPNRRGLALYRLCRSYLDLAGGLR
ncbi:MAG: ParB N-terminal domain-containing protein [Chloroflexi bacterium]|nr:ParB N-terminal domain-containing protein [Chloroflexota bacterium]